MSTDNNDMCANCGKGEEESISLKKCGACKMVKYCSAACQHAHRPQHKKECKIRAAELHDEALFKQPPLPEDCPICFLRMPSLHSGRRYQACCGKIICSGCIFAVDTMTSGDFLCPFCRAPAPSSEEEMMEREKKRVEVGDPKAIFNQGVDYYFGDRGFPLDRNKALELWHRAGELGNAESYHNIGNTYWYGNGVARDEKKAIHYWELAAIGGYEKSRCNLGLHESNRGNMDRALKHFMIAVEFGNNESLKKIKQMYTNGHATKDDYAKALRAHQAYQDEIKSDQRDKAAASSDTFKYYEL